MNTWEPGEFKRFYLDNSHDVEGWKQVRENFGINGYVEVDCGSTGPRWAEHGLTLMLSPEEKRDRWCVVFSVTESWGCPGAGRVYDSEPIHGLPLNGVRAILDAVSHEEAIDLIVVLLVNGFRSADNR